MAKNCIILAGGKSLRLGNDKVLEAIGDTSLLQQVISRVSSLCDDIVIVDKGRIITMGEPAALVKQHLPVVIARLPATAWPVDKPLPENSELRNGVIEICADDQSLLLAQLESSCAHLSDLKIEAPNLEDLFLKLTGHALRN